MYSSPSHDARNVREKENTEIIKKNKEKEKKTRKASSLRYLMVMFQLQRL